jgi:hypothetical protein
MHSIGHRLVTAVEKDMNQRSAGVLFGQPCSLRCLLVGANDPPAQARESGARPTPPDRSLDGYTQLRPPDSQTLLSLWKAPARIAISGGDR